MRCLLYTLAQWTWGLPQNLAGAALWLCLGAEPRRRYHGALTARWRPRMAGRGSLTLGMFILLDGALPPGELDRLLPHEYGHTVQSLLYGPLFLPAVALPSVLWAARYSRRHKRYTARGVRYTARYPEQQANRLGLRVTGDEPINW